jgi:hypothetical protein
MELRSWLDLTLPILGDVVGKRISNVIMVNNDYADWV